MSYVVALSEIGLGEVPLVGRKAAVLGDLLAAGFPVPDGFAVTTGALAAATGDGPWTPDTPLPAGLAGELAGALERIGGGPVAVRSSGVAEDLAGMSYAGQYESVLDVRGPEAVGEAVGTCWASGSSERVRAYHGEAGPVQVGVLVQRMVDARAAGAAFSVNPVSGAAEIVISAVRGLGERLMSGELTADEWVVRDLRGPGGERQSSGGRQAITAGEAREIAALAARVAAHADGPQDIEWVIDQDDRLWLVQARPITGLPDRPAPQVPITIDVPPGFSTRDRNSDRPWVPLQQSIFMPVFSDCARHVFAFNTGVVPTAHAIGGWTYVTTPPDTIEELVGRVEKIAVAVEQGEPERLIHRWNDEIKPTAAAVLAQLRQVELRVLSDAQLTAHLRRLLVIFTELHEVYFRLTGAAVYLFGRLGVACADLLGWDAAQTLRLRGGLSGDHVPAHTGLGELARLAAADPGTRARVEAGEIPDGPFAAAFATYVQRYGHRTIGFTLIDPTLAEQAGMLLNLVRAQLDDPYDLDTERARLAERRAGALAQARAALSGAERDRFEHALAGSDLGSPVRDEKVFYAVSAWALLRYVALDLGARLVAAGVVRQADDVFHLGHEDALAALDDHRPRHEQVSRGRGEHAWALANPGPPSYGPPPAPMAPKPGMTPPSARAEHVMQVMQWSMRLFGGPGGPSGPDAAPGELRGVAASAGRYTGPARVITSVTEFGKLRRGDVLVCPETTAQWAVLFPSVGALVTDRGSLLSHPAIIAREYGVPAVVATGSATTTFTDDQLLTVDGSTGLVRAADVKGPGS